MNRQQTAYKVSVNTIILNVMLSIFKFVSGIVSSSGAMISDAVHSASDVLSTVIVIIGVKISGKESDQKHPYGHERLECVAALILAVILAVTGFCIGINGIQKIISVNKTELRPPGILALIAAFVSIIVKEGMYWYTRKAAKKINSGVLMADAWHHRSDSLSSIGSFIGIFGARLGFPVLDPAAGVLISVFIIKVSYDISADSIRKMLDESSPKEIEDSIENEVGKINGVKRIDLFKTRMFGDKIYVDIEIAADGNKTLFETHSIAENVHKTIELNFPQVKHCMVHVNPYEEK